MFLVFAISGIGISNAWDFSDYHDAINVHIDSADSNNLDMDNVKIKPLILTSITIAPYILPQPLTFVTFHTSTAVEQINPRLNIIRLFPSRASPV